MKKNYEVRYIVDQEHRKIICLLSNTKYAFYDFVEERANDLILPINKRAILYMPNTFRGVATCAPEDEWNEELGKHIAYARARYKFDVSFFRHANNFMHYFDNTLDRLSEDFNRYGVRIGNNQEYRMQRINKYLKNFELFTKE